MDGKQLEIAVYGKGGIGKSTICANLSAALAERGKKVLQIGCDPKHDSTRLLMNGRMLPTVLEYLRDTPAEYAKIENVLGTGYLGVGCIEAGGPKPGIGCAGRGIISAFEYLEKNKIKEKYDIVGHDVLGDVVCGGFAVPIRREYADAVFLVTSGEFMALYAANNILKGIRNFDGDKYRRVAGIIFNRRMVEDEEGRVQRFAKAVGLPVCAVVPRSNLFAKAEEEKRTVVAMGIEGEERNVFLSLADLVGGEMPLYEARPLDDEDLEAVVLEGKSAGREISAAYGNDQTDELCNECMNIEDVHLGLDKIESAPTDRMPLYGCAFNGASTASVHLTDAIIIAHSPKSCAFYTWQNISAPGRRNLFNRGILMPSAISPNFETTAMDDHDAVFGGIDKLKKSVEAAISRKPGAVIVISACVSGIIGDDVISVEDMSTDEVPVIVIPADGDISGDYMHGIEMSLQKIGERLIKKDVETLPCSVNIIGEAGVSNNTEINIRTVEKLLKGLGIKVNCRFLGDASVKEVENLCAAPLNILAYESPDNLKLKEWLIEKYNVKFFDKSLPVGYIETESFLRDIAAFFGREDLVDNVLEEEKEEYLRDIESLKERLCGRKVLMTTINANIDWLMDTAEDAGVEFVWIGVLNYLRQNIKVTSNPKRKEIVHEIFGREEIFKAIDELKPDIVITNYTDNVPGGEYIIDSLPMTQRVGFGSGLDVLDRWALLLENRREGEWINDREFFEKYFA